MLCYKDRTWCVFDDCNQFGADCQRSLTEDVVEAAQEWWGGEGFPVVIFASKPICFVEKDDGRSATNTSI